MDASDESKTIVVLVDTTSPDLGLVDMLARLQVAAHRYGWSIRVQATSRELCELLDFVGLADVLLLESRRKTEGREQLGVEEVMQPGDPAV
jgi:hypothetical protein